ncbi:MAG: SDR family oxidoreductase [Bacteroidales bacterium]
MYTAIVTGGAQGIGKAISMKLMQQKIFVFVLDHDKEALEDFQHELTTDQTLFQEQEPLPADVESEERFPGFPQGYSGLQMCRMLLCDVADSGRFARTLESIAQQRPSLRYLVNNAAVAGFKPMEELSLEEWNHVLAVNLTSCFIATRSLADNLRRNKGAIVNLCSTRAFMSEPHTEAYSASKGGVFSLTHALAMSLQPHVRVNSISPGWVDVTPWQKKRLRRTPHWAEKHHLQHPAGRIGTPEDIAELCWYLLSDKASFITGQNFIADGGMTRKMIYEEE